MDNPLYNGGGKGSNPRNCHTPKFRKNYDSIKWINKAIDNTIKEMIKVSKKKKKK